MEKEKYDFRKKEDRQRFFDDLVEYNKKVEEKKKVKSELLGVSSLKTNEPKL